MVVVVDAQSSSFQQLEQVRSAYKRPLVHYLHLEQRIRIGRGGEEEIIGNVPLLQRTATWNRKVLMVVKSLPVTTTHPDHATCV